MITKPQYQILVQLSEISLNFPTPTHILKRLSDHQTFLDRIHQSLAFVRKFAERERNFLVAAIKFSPQCVSFFCRFGVQLCRRLYQLPKIDGRKDCEDRTRRTEFDLDALPGDGYTDQTPERGCTGDCHHGSPQGVAQCSVVDAVPIGKGFDPHDVPMWDRCTVRSPFNVSCSGFFPYLCTSCKAPYRAGTIGTRAGLQVPEIA